MLPKNAAKKDSKHHLPVKDSITTAFFALLARQEWEQITVSALVKEAGVSRMGFYRHYESKEDVLDKYIFDCFLQTVREIERTRPLSFQIEQVIYTTLVNFQKHAADVKLLLDRDLEYLLLKSYERAFYYLYNQKRPSRVREYATRILIGEMFNLEMAWLKGGMVETPAQLTKIYHRILKLRSQHC